LTQPASAKVERVLLVSFLAFAATAIVQPSDDLYRAFFYAGLFPAALWVLKTQPASRQILSSPGFRCALALLTLLLVSVLWSEVAKPSQAFIRHTRWYLATLGFFAALCLYGFLGLHRSRLHGYVLSFAVIAASAEALTMYVWQERFPERAI